jgi:hypothetical protein
MLGAAETFLRSFSDSNAWGHLTIAYPMRIEIWTSFGVIVLLFGMLGVCWRWITQSEPIPVKIRTIPGVAENDWNVVRASVNMVRKIYPTAKIGEVFTVRIAKGLRVVSARIRAQSQDATILFVSERMADALRAASEKSNVEAPEEAPTQLRFLKPLLRIDLRTINSPDPNVQLQWRLGVLFFVLSWIVPRLM